LGKKLHYTGAVADASRPCIAAFTVISTPKTAPDSSYFSASQCPFNGTLKLTRAMRDRYPAIAQSSAITRVILEEFGTNSSISSMAY